MESCAENTIIVSIPLLERGTESLTLALSVLEELVLMRSVGRVERDDDVLRRVLEELDTEAEVPATMRVFMRLFDEGAFLREEGLPCEKEFSECKKIHTPQRSNVK
jgi:hypothetical protein